MLRFFMSDTSVSYSGTPDGSLFPAQKNMVLCATGFEVVRRVVKAFSIASDS